MSISAMKQVLEALDCINSPLHVREMRKLGEAMRTLRQAIAEAEKPKMRRATRKEKIVNPSVYEIPVYAIDISQERVDETAKCGHEWVGLTDEEEEDLLKGSKNAYDAIKRIEAKLKEKNCG